jgi:hypothetical protein
MLLRKDRVNSLEGKKGTNTETMAVHVHTQSRRQELVVHTSNLVGRTWRTETCNHFP